MNDPKQIQRALNRPLPFASRSRDLDSRYLPESLDLLSTIETAAGSDGMIPDPVFETDLIDRTDCSDSK
jgi:hypothetical protein